MKKSKMPFNQLFKTSLLNRFCLLTFAGIGIFSACKTEKTYELIIVVENTQNYERKSETIEIAVEKVKPLLEKFGANNLVIENPDTENLLVSQWIDLDGDNSLDQLIFQVDIPGNNSQEFILRSLEEREQQPESELTTFSRFVPERTDDYTWENDKVAFRTYGPEAQRRIEEGEPGGTLSSGIDAWLKSVEYPIIDKWYKKNEENPGAYHIDSGEGYDPYHVGSSRGIGGVGFWEDDSLFTSKNFVEYKTRATGPIRTVFELKYAPWEVNGKMVEETKRISLDLGSNLSRFESTFTSENEIPNPTIGITLHEKEGEVKANEEKGIFRYWEPMDGHHLGLGVVIDPELVQGFKDHRVEYKDGSQLLIMTDPSNNKLTYYAGFGWDKSGQIENKAEWDAYLEQFKNKLSNPLKVKVKGKKK
ncbi:DUF4861 domain-containing protein [Echinicola jeungdonensis]|uniref:DUF4861 domain-containing protein n=1 Tax=Echinicola jeungdonensis TaxID=709343 RepID=A0ABV5J9A4_9BACT|nr:DUF4861 domain-containing protein [Echinicola jeungdonensis]MDN3670490.1 DUF4861 domain-containing protein [Echinicola jeungdonensis]